MAKRAKKDDGEAKTPITPKSLGLTVAKATPYQVAPTRITALNGLLPGGLPYGKLCLFYGGPSLGKTTTCVGTVADEMAKDHNHKCLLIPAEQGQDLQYYENMGLDLNRTYVIEKDVYILEEVMQQIEQTLHNAEALGIRSVIVDSWDGMLAHRQLYESDGKTRKDAKKETVAVKAAAGARLIPLVKGLIGSKKILFLVICQVRTQGIGGYQTFEGFAGGKQAA